MNLFSLNIYYILCIFQETGQTLIAKAAADNCEDMVACFLKRKADVNLADFNGETAFHQCCKNGNVNIAAMLIYGGADVMKKNNVSNLMFKIFNN